MKERLAKTRERAIRNIDLTRTYMNEGNWRSAERSAGWLYKDLAELRIFEKYAK
jgi:hypothetical protein